MRFIADRIKTQDCIPQCPLIHEYYIQSAKPLEWHLVRGSKLTTERERVLWYKSYLSTIINKLFLQWLIHNDSNGSEGIQQCLENKCLILKKRIVSVSRKHARFLLRDKNIYHIKIIFPAWFWQKKKIPNFNLHNFHSLFSVEMFLYFCVVCSVSVKR